MLHFGWVFRGVHLARNFQDCGLDEPDATVLSMLIVERELGSDLLRE
jgi:hypothetical protein